MTGWPRGKPCKSPEAKKRRFNYTNADGLIQRLQKCRRDKSGEHSDASDIAGACGGHSDASDIAEEGHPEKECCENAGDSEVAPEGHTDS